MLFLESYMRRFIVERNDVIRKTAEGQEWKLYLPAEWAPPESRQDGLYGAFAPFCQG